MSNAVLVINSVSSTDSCDRDVLLRRVNRAIDMVNALEKNTGVPTTTGTKAKGRKPKAKAPVVETTVDAMVEAPVPKPRGRKPKAKAPVVETTVDAMVEAPVPKPRGRKPKAKAPIVETTVETTVEAPVPKPRGRKPKTKAPVVETTVDAMVEAPVPKGRKRKAIEITKVEEAPIPEKLAPVKAKKTKTNGPKGAKPTKKKSD